MTTQVTAPILGSWLFLHMQLHHSLCKSVYSIIKELTEHNSNLYLLLQGLATILSFILLSLKIYIFDMLS